MGIPSYFRFITNKYPDIIYDTNNVIENYQAKRLFLDLNCAIHKCVRNVLDNNYSFKNKDIYEEKMMHEILNYIIYLAKYIDVKDLIYIAIDGIAPKAKMNQQRLRRFKSIQEKELIKNINNKYSKVKNNNEFWDTNAITPGTIFMEKLALFLNKNVKKLIDINNLKIIISDSNSPGEGEHKIFNFIHKNPNLDINSYDIVYGLDADLMMLAMNYNNILLLRESLEFNGNSIEYDDEGNVICLYLDIDKLKIYLIKEFSEYGIVNLHSKKNLIRDYIFMSFILGNDFIPHSDSISIKEDGISILIETYVSLYNKTGQNLLINNNGKISINLPIFKIFLNKLSQDEDPHLVNLTKKILKKKPFIKRNSNQNEIELQKLNLYPMYNRKKEPIVNMGSEGWKERYYLNCFNIDNDEEIKKICINYYEGLIWNLRYYFEGCYSWTWYYKYNHAPSLQDLSNYLDININNILEKNDNQLKPFEQLLSVLPSKSSHLLPKKVANLMKNPLSPIISYYPVDFQLDSFNKTFYWQCIPILPLIKYENIRRELSKINLTEEEQHRNTFREEVVYN